jgi:hypothetical protein
LARKATELEKAARDDDMQKCRELVPFLTESLRVIHVKLSPLFASSKVSTGTLSGTFTAEDIQAVIDIIKTCDDDLSAEAIRGLMKYNADEQTMVLLGKALHAVENFGFAEAEVYLSECVRDIIP